jgi:hypothetical protein
MLTDIYVREKLNEMSREASRTQRVSAGGLGVPFAVPAARLLGRVLCRVGERLQWAGTFSERDVQAGCPREPNLHLRRTD